MKRAALTFGLMTLVTPALAGETFQYVGLTVSESEIQDAPGGNWDATDTAYHLSAGFTPFKYLSIEPSVTYLGELSLEGSSGTASIERYTVSTNLRLHTSIQQPFVASLFIGAHYWTEDADVDNAAATDSWTDDGVDLTFGFGLSWRPTPEISTSIRWQRFQLDDNDIDTIGLGAQYFFGKPPTLPGHSNIAKPAKTETDEDPRWQKDPDPWRKYDKYDPSK